MKIGVLSGFGGISIDFAVVSCGSVFDSLMLVPGRHSNDLSFATV